MMSKKLRSILLVIACTVFTSVAQVLYKIASKTISWNPVDLIQNFWLLGGMALYAGGAVLLIVALRHGSVSLLYPIIATSYIWVTLLSMFIFGEQIHYLRWIGVGAIIVGITFIAFGEKEEKTQDGLAPIGVE